MKSFNKLLIYVNKIIFNKPLIAIRRHDLRDPLLVWYCMPLIEERSPRERKFISNILISLQSIILYFFFLFTKANKCIFDIFNTKTTIILFLKFKLFHLKEWQRLKQRYYMYFDFVEIQLKSLGTYLAALCLWYDIL